MKIYARIATIAFLTGAGLSAPTLVAQAEATEMEGVYHYADEDGAVGTWTITTTCTPDCVAHVTTSDGGTFDAPLIGGRYTNTRTVPEGALCPAYRHWDDQRWIDASRHPVTFTQWWDPQTLTGEVDFWESSAPCGLADVRDTFTLTRIG